MKRYICIMLSIVMLLLFFGCSDKTEVYEEGKVYEGEVASTVELPAITSEEDALLLSNPDRGLFIEVEYDVKKNSTMYTEDNTGPTGDLERKLEKYKQDYPMLARLYIHLNGYVGTDIDSVGLERIDAVFAGFREHNIKACLTFVYQYATDGTGEADKDTMYRHMEQLAPVLEENKDVISVVYAGFLGAWGEWHSYDTDEFSDADKIDLLEHIAAMVPEEIFLMVRLPMYKREILKSDPIYNRIGFHDDALFGAVNHEVDVGNAGWVIGSWQWRMAVEEAYGVPVLGELFWGAQMPEGIEPDGLAIIRQMADMRFYAVSMAHSYIEDEYPGSDQYAMKLWKKQTIEKEWLDSARIPYAEGWFEDENGNAVSRSVFDFIRDYTGYKLEIRSRTIKGSLSPGNTIDVGLSLVNYGFSAPFNLTSNFAILDADGNLVSETAAGNPREWHNHAADNHSKDLLLHEVSGQLALPEEPGEYTIVFYIQNSMGQYARVGNKIPFDSKYHELAKIKVA